MASSKATRPATTDWKAFSAWVTTLDEKEALKELKAEAARKEPRPYVMKRYYHRWRQASGPADRAAIEMGKLPAYLVR